MSSQEFSPLLSAGLTTVLDKASEIKYDNTTSGLAATTTQAAVDEVQNKAQNLQTLSGRPNGSTDLGTFTGSIIPDNSTIKAALQSLETDIENLPTPITYKGTWNASTNTPMLANTDTGKLGFLYQVNVAGTVNFGAGNISFDIGDKVVNNGIIWEKWDMTDSVTSVNGFTGAVVLTTTNVTEGTSLYFTDERAQDAVGTILTDTASVDFTYNDAGNTISAAVLPAGVDHNQLQNFVANKHIDHSTVNIAAGTGLDGGGDITASRTLNISATGVGAGSAGSASTVPQISFVATGQLTNVNIVPIQITESQVTNLTTDLAGKQPLDATLTALAAYNTNGLLAQTAADTFTGRTLTAGSTKISVTNGNGVAGNPTVDVAEANLNLANLGGTLGISQGGTGQTTATAAFTALSPLTTKGDLLGYSTTAARVPVGVDGTFLKADSAAALGVSWASTSGTRAITTKTSAYTATNADDVILANAATAAFTVSLFTAVGNTGKVLILKKTDSDWSKAVTIDPAGSETIGGSLTTTLNTQNEQVEIISDGANWQILERVTNSPILSTTNSITTTTNTNNPTFGTISINRLDCTRRGQYAYINFQYTTTTNGTNGTGTYVLNIPSSIGTIDTSITGTYTTLDVYKAKSVVGTITVSDAPSTNRIEGGQAIVFSTTQIRVTGTNGNGPTQAQWSSAVVGFGTPVSVSGWVEVPISGWNA